MTDSKLLVVICHFKENLDWTKKLIHPYIVINKNPSQNDLFEFNLPNEGFDAAAYLTYIINNYDNLPDFMCFSQDNPFCHCQNFLKLVNDFKFDSEFLPLGITYVREGHAILNDSIKYAELYGIRYSLPIKFTAGTQYIVSKNLVLKNDKEFYGKILKSVLTGKIISHENYTFEYLFATIFHFNTELKVTTQ